MARENVDLQQFQQRLKCQNDPYLVSLYPDYGNNLILKHIAWLTVHGCYARK